MREANQRVTGRLPFAINHSLPGLLHARVLRSTSAHARIRRLDVSAAEALPGVAGVLCGGDLDDPRIRAHYGPVLPDRPVVAKDKVRYAGEPVAVVIADEEERAAEAIRHIEVEYDDLPAAFDPESAIRPEAEALHEHLDRRDFLTFPDLVLNTDAGKNIFNHFKLRRGDVEHGFDEADEVFEVLVPLPLSPLVRL